VLGARATFPREESNCINTLLRYGFVMNRLTMEIEQTLPSLEPESARHFELAVRAMLSMARRKSPMEESEFDRLASEEQALRQTLRQQGRSFSAGDRLTRDELHDRDALR
jgi:hypothetical protein